MFKDLSLQATYSSYEDDIGAAFYSPVLAESVKYDRATAYFSAKALASYSKGLERFAQGGHSIRLIVSAELSHEDYETIKQGYVLRESIDTMLAKRLQEKLSLEEERGISNLAFLISIGVIDIRIAFTAEGIFHDKFGIVQDAAGDRICFRGSNNETAAAYETNYESFDITCSWQASAFDYAKITKSQETFDKLWDNKADGVCVRQISDVVYQEISKFNKGRLITDTLQLEPDCLVLDYDTVLRLSIKINPELILNNSVYKLRLKRYVDTTASTENELVFRSHLTYPDFKKIDEILMQDSDKRGYRYFTTQRLRSYIAAREMYIEKRAKVGLTIKNHEPEILDRFEEYKLVVDQALSRKLRDRQMWDSFFMCTMKKASNFSVPGSGKTASVLGAFAYLQAKKSVKRIVMVGPKNSFGSWCDEFVLCFGEKQTLRLFNIQDAKYKSVAERRTALLFETGNCNLILLNYDCLRTYISEAKKLIDARTLLVFDEVHKVKAIEGSNAERALELAKNAVYTIALTGTPIPNSYTDIRNLLDILYHDEYNEFFGFSIQQLKNPSPLDMEMINSKFQPFFCRTTKKQLSVPDANGDLILSVPASEAENALFHILCMKYAKNKLALIVRLLQLESDPFMLLRALDLSDFSDILDISGEIEDIDYVDYSEDVKRLIDSVSQTTKFRQCIQTSEKLYAEKKPHIIWCIFVDSINRIAAALEQKGMRVGCIYGETPMEDRQLLLDAFRNGKLDVLITNPHTLAESVSLHKSCHDAIYFEYSYNLVHLLQSKDRIHRLGLPEGQYTQYYFMQELFTTKDGDPYSLDEKILIRLQEKEQIMLDAIENNQLETVTTTQEDLDLIFNGLL